MTVYTILTTHVFKASEWDRTTDKGLFLWKGQKIGKKGIHDIIHVDRLRKIWTIWKEEKLNLKKNCYHCLKSIKHFSSCKNKFSDPRIAMEVTFHWLFTLNICKKL